MIIKYLQVTSVNSCGRYVIRFGDKLLKKEVRVRLDRARISHFVQVQLKHLCKPEHTNADLYVYN